MARKAKSSTAGKTKKRNVIFEAITTVTFKQELPDDKLVEITVKVCRDCTTVKDVPYQTENNCGAEVWGWGDKNWDSFTSEFIPIKFKFGDEKAVNRKGEVIWRCITAVYDAKTKKPLPMKQESYKPWARNSHSISDMRKSARKTEAAENYMDSGFSSQKESDKQFKKKKTKKQSTDSLGLPATPSRSKQMKKAIDDALDD